MVLFCSRLKKLLSRIGDSLIREYLRKLFCLSSTIEERQKVTGVVGRWFDPSNKMYPSNERYPGLLALSCVVKISVIVGGLLLITFLYLGMNGLDANLYNKAIFPAEYMRSTGIAGLYVYYYCKIMGPVIFTIVFLCFLLFLIHVRKGEIDPFRDHAVLKFKENRNFKNFAKLFCAPILCGFLFYNAALTSYIPYLSIINGIGLSQSMSGSFVWELLSYIILIAVQGTTAIMLYLSVMIGWAIIFRYDKTLT